ncbi:MAG TPA: hypothetical protein VFU49_21485 [Ktedonobacteraceae bacterium]|nr:hypothetical protein [Ktedonobacteraceae bacterium]
MSYSDLPPLPPPDASGADVCAIMRLYIAVAQDITADQLRIVSKHIQTCPLCSREHVHIERATQLLASLEPSTPSARVDQAVMAAIAARTSRQGERKVASLSRRPVSLSDRQTRKAPSRMLGTLAAIAALLLMVFVSAHFLSGFFVPGPQAAFALPTNLSWGSYVLYHTQIKKTAQGETYQVSTYHQLATSHMNVETVVNGKIDVMMVTDGDKALGLDMMHHVAQWDAHNWGVDETMFDLTRLRHDLQAGLATYLGTDHFNGQQVYRIRWDKGLVLLLDMQYRPVNVLSGVSGPGTGTPVYNTLRLLLPTQVPASTWSMTIPKGFRMGTLPKAP